MIINVSCYLDSNTDHEYKFSMYHEMFGIKDTETGKEIQFPSRTLYEALLHHGLIPDFEQKWNDDRIRYRSALTLIRAGVENPATIAAKVLED